MLETSQKRSAQPWLISKVQAPQSMPDYWLWCGTWSKKVEFCRFLNPPKFNSSALWKHLTFPGFQSTHPKTLTSMFRLLPLSPVRIYGVL